MQFWSKSGHRQKKRQADRQTKHIYIDENLEKQTDRQTAKHIYTDENINSFNIIMAVEGAK